MTIVNAYAMSNCEQGTTIVVEVTADMARGPYDVLLYGSLAKSGSENVAQGLGNGVALVDRGQLGAGAHTYGATVRFGDGTESSTGAVSTVNVIECEVPATTAPTVPPTTIRVTLPTTVAPTTVVTIVPVDCASNPANAGCHPVTTEPTFVGSATSIISGTVVGPTLPQTGLTAAEMSIITPGAFALVVLGVVLVTVGRFRRPRTDA